METSVSRFSKSVSERIEDTFAGNRTWGHLYDPNHGGVGVEGTPLLTFYKEVKVEGITYRCDPSFTANASTPARPVYDFVRVASGEEREDRR